MVLTVRGFIYAVRGTSHHSFIYKGGYETLKQQWMSVLTPHLHIYQTALVLKIRYFASILRVLLIEKTLC